MGASENEQVARSYIESINRRDFDAARALFTEDAVLVVMGSGERLEGPAAISAGDEAWMTAFPDAQVELTAVTAAGDTVVLEFTGHGTHTGPLQTPDGEIAATGRGGRLAFCEVVQVRDGKICAVREYYDTLSLMSQLGLLPEPATAG